MSAFVQIGLSNALFAAGLAAVAFAVTYIGRNRHVAHALWLLVLVKLITPPFWHVPIPRVARWVAVEVDSPETDEAGALERAGASVGQLNITTPRDDVVTPADEAAEAEVDESSLVSGSPRIGSPPANSPAAAPAVGSPRVDGELGGEGVVFDGRAVRLLAWAWIATSGLWALVGCARVIRFQRAARVAEPAPDKLCAREEELASRFGLRRRPELRLVEGNVSPMVWPLAWRRVILLPRRLVESLTREQLDTVIAHELAHLARRDDLVRFLEAAATALHWWNPILWWARRELHAAEEDCCDALVVATLPDARRAYGEALLRTGELMAFGRSSPALASTFGRPRRSMQSHVLKRRIEMILDHELPRSASWPARLGLVGLAAIVLPLAATALSDEGQVGDSGRVSRLAQHGEPATSDASALPELSPRTLTDSGTFVWRDSGSAPDAGAEAQSAAVTSTVSTDDLNDAANDEVPSTAATQPGDQDGAEESVSSVRITIDPVTKQMILHGQMQQVERVRSLFHTLATHATAPTDESASSSGSTGVEQLTLSADSIEELDALHGVIETLLRALNAQSASSRVNSGGGGSSGGVGGASSPTAQQFRRALWGGSDAGGLNSGGRSSGGRTSGDGNTGRTSSSVGPSSFRQFPGLSVSGSVTQSGSNSAGGDDMMAVNVPESEIAALRKVLQTLAAALEARKMEGYPPAQPVQQRREIPWSYYYGSTGRREPTDAERAAYEYELRLLELDIEEQRLNVEAQEEKLSQLQETPWKEDAVRRANVGPQERELQMAHIQLRRAETKLDLFKAQHPEFNRDDDNHQK